MPKSGLTEIAVVMDQSGSMASIKTDAIGGFNTFLDAQKNAPGEALFSLVLFDTTKVDRRFLSVPIKSVPPLDEVTYTPAAGTPLYDAVAITIDEVGKKLSSMKEEDRPEKVVVVILTDGEENSSTDYRGEQGRLRLHEKIKHQSDVYKWQFVFLAANMDASLVGGSVGIGVQGCQGWQGGGELRAAYCFTSNAVTSYRGSSSPNAKVVVNIKGK